jgi:hypothetical protein
VRRLLDGARTGQLLLGDDARDRWLGDFAQSLFGSADPTLRIQRG